MPAATSPPIVPTVPEIISIDRDPGLNALVGLRWFDGPPSQFWPEFLECVVDRAEARGVILLVRDDDFAWQQRARWPLDFALAEGNAQVRQPGELIELAESAGFAAAVASSDGDHHGMAAIRLERRPGQNSAVLLLECTAEQLDSNAIVARLAPFTDIPGDYQARRSGEAQSEEPKWVVEALDLMLRINDSSRYLQACMTLCNELANRHGCDRVSLGWLRDDSIRLRAVSHMESFDAKMEVVSRIEGVMEEALDQDVELLWPRPEGEGTVVREHTLFARAEGEGFLLSLPLRLSRDGRAEPVAVLLCERRERVFDAGEVRGLRIVCDQVVRRLEDLRLADRWFGARWYEGFRSGLRGLFGAEHSVAKLASLMGFTLLLWLLFGHWNYRVEANFILRAENLSHLPAPFDGYIDEVYIDIGDRVTSGEPLLDLDTDTLLLKEAEALAGVGLQARERDKARAAKRFADMRIAAALEQQSRAQLEQVRYQLQRAHLLAPRDGVVVEGQLKRKQGAPVRKGDVLFKIAGLDQLSVEIGLDERDIQLVTPRSSGEITFVARPELEFPVIIERIDPVAIAKDGSNHFVIKAVFSGPLQPWWRPGMSGVARITVGDRSPLWVLGHRTVEFLRLYFWL